MVYRWLAVAVVALHLGYLAYLVAGGFLAWRWRRTVALHLVAAIWGVLIVTTAAPCPLTWLQNALRTRGGQRGLHASFIDTYVSGVFYPVDHEIAARALVSLVIAVSWLGLAIRCARPRPAPDASRHDHAGMVRNHERMIVAKSGGATGRARYWPGVWPGVARPRS